MPMVEGEFTRRRLLAEDEKATLKAEYRAGLAAAEIARRHRINKSSVFRILRQAGVPVRQRRFAEPDRQQMVALYEAGFNSEEVARRLGCSGRNVLKALHLAGVEVKDSRRKVTARVRGEMVTLYRLGESLAEVAGRYRVHRATVRCALAREGVELRDRPPVLPAHLKACPMCKQVKSRDTGFFHQLRCRRRTLSAYCKGCYLTYVRAQARKARARLRLETIAAYGGKCTCCGESRQEFLTIDHIDGGGAAERKSLKTRGGGYAFYKVLKRRGWPKDNYRLQCYNCNCARGHLGYCPHERERSAGPSPIAPALTVPVN